MSELTYEEELAALIDVLEAEEKEKRYSKTKDKRVKLQAAFVVYLKDLVFDTETGDDFIRKASSLNTEESSIKEVNDFLTDIFGPHNDAIRKVVGTDMRDLMNFFEVSVKAAGLKKF